MKNLFKTNLFLLLGLGSAWAVNVAWAAPSVYNVLVHNSTGGDASLQLLQADPPIGSASYNKPPSTAPLDGNASDTIQVNLGSSLSGSNKTMLPSSWSGFFLTYAINGSKTDVCAFQYKVEGSGNNITCRAQLSADQPSNSHCIPCSGTYNQSANTCNVSFYYGGKGCPG